MQEEWRDIKEYEGCYQISNLGRIKSLERYVKAKNNKLRKNKEKILSFFINKSGYLEATLCKNCKKRLHRVNRLVAETFIPNPKNKPCVNHIDGNKENNNINNLEWVTNQENQIHAWRKGLCKKHSTKRR